MHIPDSTDSLPPPAPPAERAAVPRPPWGFWPTFGLGFLGMAVMVAAQAVVTVFYAIALVVQHQIQGGKAMPASAIADQLVTDPLMLSLGVFGSMPAVGLALWLMIHLRRGPGVVDYLGLRGFRPAQFFLWAVALVVVVMGGGWFAEAMGDLSGGAFITDLLARGQHLPWLIAALVVGAPVIEELLFRGFMYRGMAGPGWRLAGAILLPNFLWVLLHVQYSAPTLAVLFVMGLVFGAARHFSGSTLLPLTLHFLSNSVSVIGALVMVRDAAAVP